MFFGKGNILNALIVIVCTVVWYGCSESEYVEYIGSGKFVPEISVDASVIGVDGVVTDALYAHVPTSADMSLRIVKPDSGREGFWKSVCDFAYDESFLPGDYIVETFYGDSIREGFECPYFYAVTRVHLNDGETLTVPLTAKLSSTMLNVRYTQAFRSYFSDFSAVLHSLDGAYVEYPEDEIRPVFLHPGNISLLLSLTMPSGETVSFEAATIPGAQSGHIYEATIDVRTTTDGVPEIVVSFDSKIQSDDVIHALTPEFVLSPAPEITCVGFEPQCAVAWIEGDVQPQTFAMDVDSDNLQRLILSTRNYLLCKQGWPAGIDLLSATMEQLEAMERLGLRLIREAGKGITVDFTQVLPHLRYSSDMPSTLFTLEAVGLNSKSSLPKQFEVNILPVDLKLVEVTDIVVGIDKGEIVVESPTSQLRDNVVIKAFVGDKWEPLEISDIDSRGNSLYALQFSAPSGTGPVPVRVYYCGSLKSELTINRVQPDYSIEVDAYALKAMIRINAGDDSLKPLITSLLRVYGNDAVLPVIGIDKQNGYVEVGGLSPATAYKFTATVMKYPSNADFCAPVYANTEILANLENGGFEETEKNFEYKEMYSGGRYSQSIVEIFNQQNRRSFDVSVPTMWANINEKTACRQSSNINTWYVEPSVMTVPDAYEGAYAVKLQSVGWDINGERIPDYLQPYGHYTPYSCNVPNIAHKSAGRLFLGAYSFNSSLCTERFDDGIRFGSRPAALNGFYKFVPVATEPDDHGIVTVEVLGQYGGKETVISHARFLFRSAMTYTAFSVPLSYSHFGVKATKLRIMFASSMHFGSIAEESVNVPVSPDLELAASLGSSLWVDGLSLSY